MSISMTKFPRASTTAMVAVTALLTAGIGCATNRSVGSQTDDAATTASVKSRLVADPEVSSYEIDVDSTDGVVRLSGWVETETERAAAQRVALRTDGVRSVKNEILLGDPSLEENVTDGVILVKVKSKLAADPDVSALDIDVDVSRGVVTLSGDVPGNAQVEEAVRLARSTDGVRSVTNKLDVTSTAR
jgi:hyperosmotically inducible protein